VSADKHDQRSVLYHENVAGLHRANGEQIGTYLRIEAEKLIELTIAFIGNWTSPREFVQSEHPIFISSRKIPIQARSAWMGHPHLDCLATASLVNATLDEGYEENVNGSDQTSSLPRPDISVHRVRGVHIETNDDTARIYSGCIREGRSGRVERRENAIAQQE
jgi:hypothetical protein